MRLRLIGTLLFIVIGVAAVVVVVFQPGASTAASAKYTTAAATRQDVVKSVVATGTVGPVAVYSLAFGSNPTATSTSSTGSTGSSSNSSGSSGTTWLVQTVNATPGMAVTKGTVLAVADTASAQLALTVAQANLASAQARLTLDQGGLSATDKASALLSVTQAKQALSQAQTSRSQTIAQNNLKLAQQIQAVNDAKAKLATDQAATPVIASQVTQDQSAIASANNQLATLRLQITQSNSQTANQVTSSQNQVTSAQLAYNSKVAGATTAVIASDNAALATAQQSVDTAQSSLDNAQLISPVDGVILTVSITAGVNAPSGSAITIQSNAFQVSASVAEADLPSLKTGQTANVTLTASGLTATGKVTQISPTGSASSGGGVVTYAILVSLPTPPLGTASGMSASISITTQSAPGVIAVPAIALVGSAGSYSVRVLDSSGAPQLVSVQVGLVTSSMAEIQSGISEGEAVVTGTSSTRTSSSTTAGGFGVPGVGVGGGGGQFRGAGGG
jgi:multidrug efflux pump subunit AcrA (membrane-fusion protein)